MSLNPSTTEKKIPGTLFIVATPIGNRDDITLRAIQTLKDVDLIACEDTRHSRKLCDYHQINTPLQALHAHNENTISGRFINRLEKGSNVALISDAGTPLISDPGFPLVQQARAHNITVSPIPGPSALITLLSASGMPTDNFQFFGFLPAKSQQRQESLLNIKPLNHTCVVYESSHRIKAALQDMMTTLGAERAIVIGRELTKKFETILSGTVSSVLETIQNDSNQTKGEFVIAIHGSGQDNTSLTPRAHTLIEALKPLLPPKKIAKIVAKHYKLDTREIYQYIISN
ncbi:16S rRNA (cytidine(1402)-2'-O)-methyltransferase [Marinicella sp. W31]|uniref:16S rRNA (cytidine(1402)-2'-O)-methyltransferase n=1 Tax=Marinicella sp. W31 TaxID=3023713 RepID=UPI00375833A5